MDSNLKNCIEDYQNGRIDRREFLKKSAILAGGAAIVLTGIPSMSRAQIVSEDDPRLETEMITYTGESGEMMAYMAKPKGAGKLPAVIVIHENRGLVPHIKDVTRRMALEGFIAIAPDALSPVGGTPDTGEDTRPLFQKIDYEKTKKDFSAAVKYLQTNPQTTGKVGCTGFCWGGAMTNHVAVNSPELKAAVPYYGSQPNVEDVPKIKASMMIHYAGDDARINAGIPAFEEALKNAGIEYEMFIYEGAQHAFNNDTNESRYHPEAAKLAWTRTIDFFKEKLGD